jgi:hypothetical protein
MGSLAALSQRPLSPERARLVEAVKRSRFTLRELSAHLGRNPSYLQQYLGKGSPRVLPESVRVQLAAVLRIPETDLRPVTQQPTPPPLPLAALGPLAEGAAISRPAGASPPPGHLTCITEDEAGRPDAAAGAYRLSALTADIPPHAIAVRLVRQHGLLQPRHILLCDTTAAPRLGDVAFIVAPGSTPAIGLLVGTSDDTYSLRHGGQDKTVPIAATVAWRVLAVQLT